MKNINRIISVALLSIALIAGGTLYAAKSKTVSSPKPSGAKADAICLPPSNEAEITVNNVRAYIKTDGTMWNKEVARYEIPKGSGKTSMFSAALWIGGVDRNNQVRLAAMRFGQEGSDYWTGPLDTRTATIDQVTCIKYDKLFKITRAEVVAHKEAFANNNSSYTMPASIKNWPGNGDWETKGQSFYLAPYFDADGDGTYTPENGDFPYYDLTNELCPWTEANLQKAARHELPYPPEELDTRIPHNTHPSDHWSAGHMVYADHVLKGDETLFWIFNDMGGAHTETQGPQIGLEIRGQVFGFATNDEINNMTFYSYEIINRSTRDLTNAYFSQWVDPDLGYADDDYVGCDVMRGLGYCYNGRNVDGSGQAWAYGDQPPAVGVDFFQGPYIDPDGRDNPKFNRDSANNTAYCTRFLNDAIDQMAINGVNFGDSIVDNERFGMRRFVYHNNNSTVTGDPKLYMDYYNMLRGFWRDNSRMRYGGTAHKDDPKADGPECDFMFPGTTDPCNWGTRGEAVQSRYQNSVGWTEESEGNPPLDRRFMQSAGPFTLNAGAVNYITVGIPWARASQGGAWASVELLKRADDACQALFENCFKVLDGPDAPDVTIRELENEVVIYLTNDIPAPIRNNFNETYQEVDPTISSELTITELVTDTVIIPIIDTTASPMLKGYDTLYPTRLETHKIVLSEEERSYKFEGYMIYQLAGKDVSVTDLNNSSKARLIRQCDIKNQYAQLTNWEYDDRLATSVPVGKVDGSNAGISHSFSITEDKFVTTGSAKLVNHKTYYYMVIAYAVNEYRHFSIDQNAVNGLLGQKKVFLAGRNNIQVYSAIPHKPAPQENGTILHSEYGTQPMITRIEGQGNGGFFLDLTDETKNKILSGGDKNQWGSDTWKIQQLTYKNNAGPLAIKVIDPIKVQPFDYRIKFIDSVAVATDKDLSEDAKWVLEILDVTLKQAEEMGYEKFWNNGVITLPSSVSISMRNEQLFLPLGISISIENHSFQIYQDEVLQSISNNPKSYRNLSMYGQVDFISSSISYKDSTHQWLSGLVDISGEFPANWIRSGTSSNGMWENNSVQAGACADYAKWKTEDAHYPISYQKTGVQSSYIRAWKDSKGQFSKVAGGTWSPYVLASPFFGGPQARYIKPDPAFIEPVTPATAPTPSYYSLFNNNGTPILGLNSSCPGFNQTMTNLYSVDIVLTDNKDLWTRCVVLEACDDATKSIGHAKAHEPRKQASVDKDGKPDGTGDGMGWFPGYAINVETGERLNIMFAENSADSANNGNDMLFNPTNVYAYWNNDPGTGSDEDVNRPISMETYNAIYANRREPNIKVVNGGKHYLYICGSSGNTAASFYRNANAGAQCRNYNDNDIEIANPGNPNYGGYFDYHPYYECGPYDEGRWLMAKFNTFVSGASPTATEMNRKMQLFNNVMWTSIPMATPKEAWVLDKGNNNNDVTIKIRVSRPYMRYTSRWFQHYTDDPYSTQNYGLPLYSFTTKNIAPTTNATDIAQSILDEINIVPNPYYGFSRYETSSLETAVKIVNLPEICDISIYTVSGILIKRISKGDKGVTSVTWDLKNSAGIPISSGMYVIHVKAPNIGERTLKFFAAMRPTDINSF